MAARPSLVAVITGTLAVVAAYAGALLPGPPPAWAAWAMVAGIGLCSTGTMALGAGQPGRRRGGVGWALVFVFLVVVGCFGAALALPAVEGPGARLLLGLPVRAAIVLYGIGWIPVFVLPAVYARTFRQLTLDQDDLDRIRAAAKARRP